MFQQVTGTRFITRIKQEAQGKQAELIKTGSETNQTKKNEHRRTWLKPAADHDTEDEAQGYASEILSRPVYTHGSYQDAMKKSHSFYCH